MALILALISLVAGACGYDEGPPEVQRIISDITNEDDAPKKPGDDPEEADLEADPNEEDDPAALNLTWKIPCDDTITPYQNGSSLEGQGKHTLNGAPAAISAEFEVCKPTLQKEVIFVVDISTSMRSTDPRDGNSCARRDAINTFILSQPNASYGLVTFDSRSQTTRAPMDAQEFRDENTAAQTLCTSRILRNETDYRDGLRPVLDWWSEPDAQTQRELYFVTDSPSGSISDGLNFAEGLRDNGVSIATIMIAGEDAGLRQNIASRSPKDDEPYHTTIAQANGLADALMAASEDKWASAALRYRAAGQSEWITQELPVDALSSVLKVWDEPIATSYPKGLEVEIDLQTSKSQSLHSAGALEWPQKQSSESSDP